MTKFFPTLGLLLLLAAATATARAADTPADILKDYHGKALKSLARLNATLEAEAAKIAAELVKNGDTEAAKSIPQHVHQVLAGRATQDAPPAFAVLLQKYEAARNTTLAPVRKEGLARIDAMLKMAGGQKMETVAALASVRQEIEGGSLIDDRKVPLLWTYHDTPDDTVDAHIVLNLDGTYVYTTTRNQEVVKGTWKAVRNDFLTLNFKTDVWKVTIKGDLGTVEQDVGTRYMWVAGKAPNGPKPKP